MPNKPRIQPARKCDWCQSEFRPQKRHGRFCSADCRTAANNFLKHWAVPVLHIKNALRNDRKGCEAVGLTMTHLDRFVMHIRHKCERNGHQPFMSPAEIMEKWGTMMSATTHRI